MRMIPCSFCRSKARGGRRGKGGKVLIGGKRPDLPEPYNKVLSRGTALAIKLAPVLALLACCWYPLSSCDLGAACLSSSTVLNRRSWHPRAGLLLLADGDRRRHDPT